MLASGKNVQPEEIETCLQACDAVAEAGVARRFAWWRLKRRSRADHERRVPRAGLNLTLIG